MATQKRLLSEAWGNGFARPPDEVRYISRSVVSATAANVVLVRGDLGSCAPARLESPALHSVRLNSRLSCRKDNTR